MLIGALLIVYYSAGLFKQRSKKYKDIQVEFQLC